MKSNSRSNQRPMYNMDTRTTHAILILFLYVKYKAVNEKDV
jgi:hypothetical protein